MRRLMIFAGLLGPVSAPAATLVVDLFTAPDAETPFKEIRCDGTACAQDGLLPLDDVSVPVAFAVKLDKERHLWIAMDRLGAARYEISPVDGPFLLGQAPQHGRLLRDRDAEGRKGLTNDLVVREGAELSDLWVSARLEK